MSVASWECRTAMPTTAGKTWCLRRLADEDGFFRMVAVDQRPGVEALVRQRQAEHPGDLRLRGDAWDIVGRFKRLLVEELSPHASAMLLDPHYAYPAAVSALDPRRGLLVTLEQFASEDGPGGRKTLAYPGWTVEKIKRLGADGVKLMLWWRPDAAPDVLEHQRRLVEQVGQACRTHDIAFLLEPLVYPLGPADGADTYHEDPGKRPEMVIETVEEFRQERYGIDIFKLETPVPAASVPDPDDGSTEAAGRAGMVPPHRRLAGPPVGHAVGRRCGRAVPAHPDLCLPGRCIGLPSWTGYLVAGGAGNAGLGPVPD